MFSLLGASLALPAANASGQEAPAAPVDTGVPQARSVSIFFYPWWGTADRDGDWRHWTQSGKNAPDSIGSNYYPARGVYSSSDPAVLDAQMHEIATAGIDTVVTSWWGRNSYEDKVLPAILVAAKANGVKVAAHIEPYDGRGGASLEGDFAYLHGLGIRQVYIYNAMKLTASSVQPVVSHYPDVQVFVQSGGPDARSGALAQWAASAGAYAIYTYDPYGVQPSQFADICNSAKALNVKCAPSVGPGWDGTRATKFTFVKSRRNGATYDEAWQAALDTGADVISITSYNEWHEGTTIEPAAPKHCQADNTFCYQDYDGAYGWTGASAGWAYLDRTRFWTAKAKNSGAMLGTRLDVIAGAIRLGDSSPLAAVASSPALAARPAKS